MVETINPVVYGDERRSRARYRTALALHVLGATAAAALFGAALGGAGALVGAPFGAAGRAAVAAVAVLYLLREAFGVPVPVIEARRQVPDWWRTFFSRNVTAFLYGTGVGIGFLTYLGHGTLLVVSVAAGATGRPLAGALLLASFGFARALAVAAGARTDDPSALVNRLARFARRGWARVAHGVALALVAVAAVAASRDPGARDVGAILSATLAIVFAWAAIAKAVAPAAWTRALDGYGLHEAVRRIALVGVPVAELAVPLLVVFGLPVVAGVLAALLVGAFSGGILLARARRGDRLPCGCFGGVRVRDYRAMLARNAALALLAVAATTTGTDAMRSGGVSVPSGGDALPFAVVAISVSVAAWTLVRGLSELWSVR
jgi:hypothetical protein